MKRLHVFDDREVRKVMKRIPQEVTDLDSARVFLSETLSTFYKIGIKQEGKYGCYVAVAVHKRRRREIKSTGGDLQGVVKRMILAA